MKKEEAAKEEGEGKSKNPMDNEGEGKRGTVEQGKDQRNKRKVTNG